MDITLNDIKDVCKYMTNLNELLCHLFDRGYNPTLARVEGGWVASAALPKVTYSKKRIVATKPKETPLEAANRLLELTKEFEGGLI